MRARRIDGESPRAACADSLHIVDATYDRPASAWVVEQLQKLCRECPLKTECGTAAMQRHEDGVWGGMTGRTRTQLGAPPSPRTRRS